MEHTVSRLLVDHLTFFSFLPIKCLFQKHLINLYVNVLNQIRKFKKPRFTRYLMFLIATEYHSNGSYEDALTYFNNIISFYREEKWNEIYFEIINLAIDSAYYSADMTSFIKFAFEQMDNCNVTETEKTDLFSHILALLNFDWKPLQLPADKDILSDHLEAKWTTMLKAVTLKESISNITIAMDYDSQFLACKVAFSSSQYFIGNKVIINVAIFSSLPLDLSNLTLQLRFSNAYYDQFCMCPMENPIDLKANTMSTFTFEFKPLLEDRGKELRVSDLTLKLEAKQSIIFHWKFLGGEKLSAICMEKNEKSTFNKFRQVPVTRILEHHSKLNVELVNFGNKAFVNEHFPIGFRFVSSEEYLISNIQVSLKVLTADDQLDTSIAVFSIAKNEQLKLIEERHILIEKLGPGQSAESQIVLKMATAGLKSLICSFSYDLLLESEKSVQFILVQKQLNTSLDIVQPFAITSRLATLDSGDTGAIRVEEPFKLHIEVVNIFGDDSIQVTALTPNLTPNCQILTKEASDVKWPFILDKQSQLKQSYHLACLAESPTAFSLGNCLLHWTRKEKWQCALAPKWLMNESQFQLPSTLVAHSSVFLELHLPDACYSRSAFMARYRIYNRLDVDMTVEIGMGHSDCFMVSGNKLVSGLLIESPYGSILFTFLRDDNLILFYFATDQSVHQSSSIYRPNVHFPSTPMRFARTASAGNHCAYAWAESSTPRLHQPDDACLCRSHGE